MNVEALSVESAVGVGEAAEPREETGLVEELRGVLEKVQVEDSYQPDRDRQRAVLANLPQNLVEELRAQLYAAHLERKIYKEKSGREPQPLSDRGVVAGRLFELLCENDPKINKNPKDPVVQEILGVWQRPEMRGLENQLGGIRNPDVAMIEYTPEGRIVIRAIGEAKAGLLDRRAYLQLKNFTDSLHQLLGVLNGNDNLRDLGLEALAKAREEYIRSVIDANPKVKPEKFSRLAFIDISDDLRKVLIVPANRDTDDRGSLLSLELKGHGRANMLSENMTRVEVEKAAFSGRELHALVEHFASQIPEIEKK